MIITTTTTTIIIIIISRCSLLEFLWQCTTEL